MIACKLEFSMDSNKHLVSQVLNKIKFLARNDEQIHLHHCKKNVEIFSFFTPFE